MKRFYKRKAGAFDRYLSNQVDSEGAKVLKQDPLHLKDQPAYDRDMLRREQRQRQQREIARLSIEERRAQREKQEQQRERFKAESNPQLYEEYNQAIEEAVKTGLLTED